MTRSAYAPETSIVIRQEVGGEVREGSAQAADTEASDREVEPQAALIKKDLRGWGFGLVAMGLFSLALSSFLDPSWGIVLIAVGLLSLVVLYRGMFIAIGGVLLLAGAMNLATAGAGTFRVYGALQLYWGLKEMRKFWTYRPQ